MKMLRYGLVFWGCFLGGATATFPVSYAVLVAPNKYFPLANGLDGSTLCNRGGQDLCTLLPLTAADVGATVNLWDKVAQSVSFKPEETLIYSGDPGIGWIEGNGNLGCGPIFAPGQGFFLILPPVSSGNLTFSGCFVPCSAAYVRPIPAGQFCFLGRRLLGPTVIDFKDTIGTFESIVGERPKTGDLVYRLDPFAPSPFFPLGFVPHTFKNGRWSPVPPLANLGEAVLVRVKLAPTTGPDGPACTGTPLPFRINGVVPNRTNNSTATCLSAAPNQSSPESYDRRLHHRSHFSSQQPSGHSGG